MKKKSAMDKFRLNDDVKLTDRITVYPFCLRLELRQRRWFNLFYWFKLLTVTRNAVYNVLHDNDENWQKLLLTILKQMKGRN